MYANFTECLTYKFHKYFLITFSFAFIIGQLSIDVTIKVIISLNVVTSLQYYV